MTADIRTVRLWCAYDYVLHRIITTACIREIARQDVQRVQGTILLELKGTYAMPKAEKSAKRKGRR